jgi:hypothetical protein
VVRPTTATLSATAIRARRVIAVCKGGVGFDTAAR